MANCLQPPIFGNRCGKSYYAYFMMLDKMLIERDAEFAFDSDESKNRFTEYVKSYVKDQSTVDAIVSRLHLISEYQEKRKALIRWLNYA